MTPQDAAMLASLTGYVGNRWPHRMASDVAPDLHRIATEQAVEIARLRAGLETIKSASKHYAKGDCDLSYAHQSTHNLAAATLEAGQ